MKNRREDFIEFHARLMGFNLERDSKPIDKYVAYWSGNNSRNILDNKLRIIAVKKQKK